MEEQKQLRERHIYLVLIKHCNIEYIRKTERSKYTMKSQAKIIWNNEITYFRNKITKNERECGLNISNLVTVLPFELRDFSHQMTCLQSFVKPRHILIE